MATKKDIFKAPGDKRRLTHRTINDDAAGRLVEFHGRANYHRKSDKLKKMAKRTITLKSGEVIEAGKKHREPKKKPLRSWGDELPRFK